MFGRKLKKLIKSPGTFLRDLLIKRYPISYNEMSYPEDEESVLLKHDLDLCQLPANTLPIDVVFTWVNDRDPVWRDSYMHAKQHADPDFIGLYGDDSSRFANHDELRWSLLSVQRFMPWVNRIHIVTDGQCPDWLQPDDKLRIVDHRQLINPQYLPTFNSHVIEAHLHKVPDLTEHFIYFNDDVFVARPLPPEHFFRSNGIASLFASKKSFAEMQLRGVETPTLSASLRGAEMLKEDYLFEIDQPLVHTYIPLCKSMFELSWSRYSDVIDTYLCNRFRGTNDLNLASFLVPWMSYLEGFAVPVRDISYYFNLRSPAAETHYRALLNKCNTDRAPHSFCANDFHSNADSNLPYEKALHSMLNEYYNTFYE